MSLAFFHSILSRSIDLFLLHADAIIQEAQVCQHGGLHADGGVWLPVALHGADEGLPTAAGLAFVSALPERLLHWGCSGNKGMVYQNPNNIHFISLENLNNLIFFS